MKDLNIATIVTVSAALIGYFITYFNNLRLQKRKDKLDRINNQLNNLYGPLYAMSKISQESWNAFIKKDKPNIDNPTEKDIKNWTIWVQNVFMPINDQIYEVVIKNSSLLVDNEFNKPILNYCIHVAIFKTLIKRWEENDYSELYAPTHLSSENFADFDDYVKNSYLKIKKKQNKLLE